MPIGGRRHPLPAFLQQQQRERQEAVDLVLAMMERTIRAPRGLAVAALSARTAAA